MKTTRVIYIFMLLFLTGVSISSKVLAGKGDTETAVSLPPGLPENRDSQQESFPVYKYPLFLVNRLRETIGNRLSTGTSAKSEPDNYPWAIKPKRTFCSRPGYSGVFHRHRELLRVASKSTAYVGAVGGLGFAGAALASVYLLLSESLIWGFIAGEALGAVGVWAGVAGLQVTESPVGGPASRIYQCNHELCIEVPRLRSGDAIDGRLRCPGNNEYLLRHPVMISGYEQPLSLEFVMQCIRDKTPFPQKTSSPMKWSRIIAWKNLSISQQDLIRTLYKGSQEWLWQNRPQDLKAVSMNGEPQTSVNHLFHRP